MNFIMKVTGFHTSSLDRQVTERVNIENFQGPVLMNRQNELGGVRLERVQYRRWAVIKGSKKASRGAKRRRISWQEEPEGGWRCAGVLGNFLNVKQDSRAFSMGISMGKWPNFEYNIGK